VLDLQGFPTQDHAPVPSSTFGKVHQPSTDAKSSVDLIRATLRVAKRLQAITVWGRADRVSRRRRGLLSVMGHASTDQIRR
jgi:hypothetical protein